MEKKKPKTIKIWIFEGTVGSFIALGIMLLFILLYILSPKAYSVTTARYAQGSDEDNQKVLTALGSENTEEDFELYFQWYNVVHELGHGLIVYNSDIKTGRAEEEQLVNDFAVAYWRACGEKDKLDRLEKITEYASSHIKSGASGENYLEFGKNNWGKSDFFTFENYGWFQFSSTRESLRNNKSLDEVLTEMGISGYRLPESFSILEYPEINEDASTRVINDAVGNFHSWGLEFPPVHHHFSNDPNNNSSRPVKNMLLFDIPSGKPFRLPEKNAENKIEAEKEENKMETILVMDEKNYDPDMEEIHRVSVRGIIFIDGKLLMIEDKNGEVKLPGGGMEAGESDLDALIREVKEETGYDVIPETVKPFGEIEEKRLSSHEPMIWHQDSRLYFCDVRTEQGDCDYTETEKKYGLKQVLCPIDEAIEKNRAMLDTGEQFSWYQREYKTLTLIKEYLDNN